MKKLLITMVLVACVAVSANAQTKNVGIGTTTPHASAILDLDVSNATDFATKLGLLVPRMTVAQRDAIVNPAEGLLVYVTDATPSAGFYYRSGTEWKSISSVAGLRGAGAANQLAYFASADSIASSTKLTIDESGNLIVTGANVNLSTGNLNITTGNINITNGNIDLLSIASGAAKEVRFHGNGGSANYIAVKAPNGVATNLDFVLPGNAGSTGQVLTRTPTGTEWQAVVPGSGGAPPPAAVYMPSGAMMMFAGTSAPDGWLICDGAAVSRADNASLFTAIGTAYGAGDGTTTFNLPNMTGRMPVGANTTYPVGQTGGSATVTIAEANMPAHTHTLIGLHHGPLSTALPVRWSYLKCVAAGGADNAYISAPDLGSTVKQNGLDMIGYGGGPLDNGAVDDGAGGAERKFSSKSIKKTGGNEPLNAMPPYTVVNYIIKK